MQFNDLSSLLQLSVGANLGFGALTSFYEPLSTKTERDLSVIDKHYASIVERHGRSGKNVSKVFQITKLYSELRGGLGVLELERNLLDGLKAKTAFMLCGVISFICLVIVSLAADANSAAGFAVLAGFAICLNLPPLIFGVTMYFVAARHETKIHPLVERIQNLLFENFVRAELAETGARVDTGGRTAQVKQQPAPAFGTETLPPT